MSASYEKMTDFFAMHNTVVLIKIIEAKGSTPREADAFMLVSDGAHCGTIGGGRLEFIALEKAGDVLSGADSSNLKLALGPELNQCCGGHVSLSFNLMNELDKEALLTHLKQERDAQPWVYIFGAGHVGLALHRALLPLPFNVKIIDSRPNLPNLPKNVLVENLAMPESVIETAPHGTSFVIMTHDHALDFILTTAALKRDDTPYIGMIGSKTKRQVFKNEFIKQGGDEDIFSRLICPMAQTKTEAATSNSKKPEVIAALIAAELISQ